MKSDIVIRHGRVVDGTGNPWFTANIGILDGRISRISRTDIGSTEKEICADGLVVAPGFFDLHNHSDSAILVHNRAENLLHMGLVTCVAGNCGKSAAPITKEYRDGGIFQENFLHHFPPQIKYGEVNWTTLDEWRDCLHRKGIGVNIAHCCGHNTIRQCVMGDEGNGGERMIPRDDELEKMRRMVAEAMEDGAFGMTTGLLYSPGRNASTEEVIELCKIVASYGGVYLSHIRGEGETLIEATKELIEICERAGVAGCLGHYKASGKANWGKPTESMKLIDAAWERGVEIYCDFYPWTYSNGQSLGMGIIRGHFASRRRLETLTREGLLQELKDQHSWNRIKEEYVKSQERNVEKNKERAKELAERGIKVPKAENPREAVHLAYSKTRPDLVWKSLGEITEALGATDYLEAMKELYIADEGFTYLVGGSMNEEDLITILKHPVSSPSTDTDTWDLSKASFSYGVEERLRWNHPRGWGSYPIILQKYVREKKIIRLEEAVRKMTSLPAQFLGLQDRGIIKEGMWADIVVFDPEKVACRATYARPMQYPDGIPYVIVNGQLAIDQGRRTEALPGKVLFHKN